MKGEGGSKIPKIVTTWFMDDPLHDYCHFARQKDSSQHIVLALGGEAAAFSAMS